MTISTNDNLDNLKNKIIHRKLYFLRFRTKEGYFLFMYKHS